MQKGAKNIYRVEKSKNFLCVIDLLGILGKAEKQIKYFELKKKDA